MPLVRISLIKDKPASYRGAVADTIHQAGLRSIGRLVHIRFVLFVAMFVWLGFLPQSASLAASSGAGVVIYRDDYGVPHIYGDTAEAGLYGSGWAQAEDRLEEILKNYLRGVGEMAATFGGEENFSDDTQARMWDFYGVAKKNYGLLMPEVQRQIAAFVDGINDYMTAHPDQVPAWWGDRKADKYMPVAFGRQYIWGWPAGQAFSDLKSVGLTPNFSVDPRSSNEIAVSPSRTKEGVAMLIIDPHLSWWGRQRFWELRLHAGNLHASGFATAGVPYVGLGHTENVAWAHTTGGPDTADIYALTLNPANRLQYKYDSGFKDLTARTVAITVKGEGRPRQVTFYDSHDGPIVAKKDNVVYAAKLAYAEDVGYIESKYLFNTARTYKDAMKAMEGGRIMPQNVMVADTDGNIYYQRTGKVPIRPAGYDWTKPVDGSTSKTEWLGFHKTSDLISVLNPPQGYMQNCNIPPDVMMVASPMTADKYPPYMFNQQNKWTHQRAVSAVKWLEDHKSVSVEDMKALALDTYCYQYERWVAELTAADKKLGGEYKTDSGYKSVFDAIKKWDGYARADSNGALCFYYWRHTLYNRLGDQAYTSLAHKIDDYLAIFGWGHGDVALTEQEARQLVESLAAGAAAMRADLRRLDGRYGDVFRVGRDESSWPVGGGSLTKEGMATLRAIGFEDPKAGDHSRWGHSGQTSTELVVLSKPIKSFTQPPIGESDRRGSPHYRDQAEKLFSPARMKPTWFSREELMAGHVKSKTELVFKAK